MSLNDTPSGERPHIVFFGLRNAGKSSLVNAITNQNLAVVSPQKGTTTDLVRKAMELLPLGPVLIIDTPGLDDEGDLGALRVAKAKEALAIADVAILVTERASGLSPLEQELVQNVKKRGVPCLIARNKCDLLTSEQTQAPQEFFVSAKTGQGLQELKEAIAQCRPQANPRYLLRDLVQAGDFVLLIIPIDKAAPKGRLILPQQQALRDLLDGGAIPIVTGVKNIPRVLANMQTKPVLAVTDSQVFKEANACIPQEIPLTSFSILMARYKGFLEPALHGAAKLAKLQDGDRVLIAEGCTHHRQCEDIGTVKIPRWLKAYTKKELQLETSSGLSFPQDLSPYAVIIHCGGCMLTPTEMAARLRRAQQAHVPLTNYGLAIAMFHGILRRGLSPLPDLQNILPPE